MASASTPSVNAPTRASFYHIVNLKPIIKAQISVKLATIGISDVVTASVYSEKTCLKKLMKIIIIMNKSQETTIFHGRQKLTSAMN